MSEERPSRETEEYNRPPVGGVNVQVEIAARSEVGLVRLDNEDHYLIGRLRRAQEVIETNVPRSMMPALLDEVGHVMIVADGMGGMASGEEASRLAISIGMQLVGEASSWITRLGPQGNAAEVLDQMKGFVVEVNRRVAEQASLHSHLEGMGTTLTAAYSLGLDLFVVHAGDSRTYLWHGGTLQQITKDHTVAQTLFEEGRIEQEELKTHRFRNVLTNYVGNPIDGIDTEMHRVELNVGDRLLLCSDGLSDMVDDEAIEAIMAGSGSPAEACEQLVAAALAGGGKDNVTAVVAYYSAGA